MNKNFEILVNQMTADELEEAVDFVQQAKETLQNRKQQNALDKIISAFNDYLKEYYDLYIVTPCGDQLDTTYINRGAPITATVSDGIAEICFSQNFLL